MTRKQFSLIGGLLWAVLWAQTSPSIPTIDVYNANFAYVHEWRSIDLQKGLNSITIEKLPREVESASIRCHFQRSTDEVTILEQKFLSPLPLAQLWPNSCGKRVRLVLKETPPITGLLLQCDGQYVLLQPEPPGGEIVMAALADVSQAWLEAGQLPTPSAPLLIYQVEAKVKAKLTAELAYQVRGINWNAEYTLILSPDEKNFRWSGQVQLSNQSELQLEQAKLRLVAGTLRQREIRGSLGPERTYQLQALAKSAEPVDFVEEPVSDYHVYTLDRPISLSRQEDKQIALFPEVRAQGEKVYLFYNSMNSEREGNLLSTFRFANTKNNRLGIPLPAGNVRIFNSDPSGDLFLGQDALQHTAENDTVLLTIGEAFDIKGRHSVKERSSPKPRSELLTIVIELNNQKSAPIRIRVEEQMYGDWYIKNASHPYIRLSNQKLLFPINMNPQQKETITYTVQRNW